MSRAGEPDGGPYPSKLPKVLRTHQVALEREKAREGMKREGQVG